MMKNTFDRRRFIKNTAVAGIGLGLAGKVSPLFGEGPGAAGKRVGIIGLDTSHAVAFTKELNSANSPAFNGYKVVTAYPMIL